MFFPFVFSVLKILTITSKQKWLWKQKKLCCGIDVSHTKLDVCYQNNLGELFHLQVGNNNSGYQKIIEYTGVDYHFVMEATGVYYIRLAFYLHQQQCKLSVGQCTFH